MKTVLVVDDNFGFLFWLGETLENAGYNVVPAANISEAHSLLRSLALAPDLLIISPTLSESAEFIGTLGNDWPGVRVVAAIEEGMTEANWIQVNADRWGRKPSGLIIAESATLDPTSKKQMEDRLRISRAEWLLIVRTALEGRATSAD